MSAFKISHWKSLHFISSSHWCACVWLKAGYCAYSLFHITARCRVQANSEKVAEKKINNARSWIAQQRNLSKECVRNGTRPVRIHPHNVGWKRNRIPLHVRKEHSLWICKVIAEAGFCPHSHVLFNEPGVGLTWFACACYRITQCHCSCPLSPNIGTFWFYFSLGLSVSLREQKDLDSIFHQGGCWGFHLCALSHQGWSFCCFEEYVRMWACVSVWSEVCRLKWGMWASSAAPLWGKALRRKVLMWSLSLRQQPDNTKWGDSRIRTT